MNLKFFSTKDKIPKHDSQIIYIVYNEDYISESIDFRFGSVEYNWDDGNGCSICYDENDSEPPETKDEKYPFHLTISIDGYDYGLFVDKNKPNKMEILWAYYDDIFDKIIKTLQK